MRWTYTALLKKQSIPPSRPHRDKLGAGFANTVDCRDVDAIRAPLAEQQTGHRHALADVLVQPTQHELQRGRFRAQRTRRVLRTDRGLVGAFGIRRIGQRPIAPALRGEAANDSHQRIRR